MRSCCSGPSSSVMPVSSAHRAIRQAHVALTGLVGLGAAAQRTIDATRSGELARDWQARRLRPPKLGAQPVLVAA